MSRINFLVKGSELANYANTCLFAGNSLVPLTGLTLPQLLSGPWARLS
jgi:hypothetical protein